MKRDNAKDDLHPRTQAEKFADLARELDCDEDQGRFAEKMVKVAKAPRSEKAGGRH